MGKRLYVETGYAYQALYDARLVNEPPDVVRSWKMEASVNDALIITIERYAEVDAIKRALRAADTPRIPVAEPEHA